jgi:hypothetical protein
MNKSKLYESLERFIDAVSKGDQEAESDAMKSYIDAKSRVTLTEINTTKSIKFDGNNVTISGKTIGSISDSGKSPIHFTSEDGKLEEDFKSLDELYAYLADNYNVSESTINEHRVDDAVSKQSAGRAERMKRLKARTKQPDGSPGDYKGGDLGAYKDPIKGKSAGTEDTNIEGGENENTSRTKKGFYDKVDPRKVHSSGKAVDGDHGMEDRVKGGYYDSEDVRKAHNSAAGGSAAPKGGKAVDTARLKTGFYDRTDPERSSNDGAAADLKTSMKYDSNDVRKKHNS